MAYSSPNPKLMQLISLFWLAGRRTELNHPKISKIEKKMCYFLTMKVHKRI